MYFPYWTSHCGENFLVLTAEDFNLGECRSGVEEEVRKVKERNKHMKAVGAGLWQTARKCC